MRLDLGECVPARYILHDRVWSLRAGLTTSIPVQNHLWGQLDEQLDSPLLDSMTTFLDTLQESLHETRR